VRFVLVLCEENKSFKDIGAYHRKSQLITGGVDESTVAALNPRSNPELDQIICQEGYRLDQRL
jgi:hypothetical protein